MSQQPSSTQQPKSSQPLPRIPSNRFFLKQIAKQNVSQVQPLIIAKANVNAKDEHGESALLIAIGTENTEIIDILLSADANPNQANADGVTPLISAAALGNLTIARKLLAAGAKANILDYAKNSALYYLAFSDKPSVLLAHELLLHHPALINQQNSENGATPLMAAAQQGALELVELLIVAKATLRLTNTGGQTARDLAQAAGHTLVSNYLIEGDTYEEPKAKKDSKISPAKKEVKTATTTQKPAMSWVAKTADAKNTAPVPQGLTLEELEALAGSIEDFIWETPPPEIPDIIESSPKLDQAAEKSTSLGSPSSQLIKDEKQTPQTQPIATSSSIPETSSSPAPEASLSSPASAIATREESSRPTTPPRVDPPPSTAIHRVGPEIPLRPASLPTAPRANRLLANNSRLFASRKGQPHRTRGQRPLRLARHIPASPTPLMLALQQPPRNPALFALPTTPLPPLSYPQPPLSMTSYTGFYPLIPIQNPPQNYRSSLFIPIPSQPRPQVYAVQFNPPTFSDTREIDSLSSQLWTMSFSNPGR